jgi:hypothetical protein
MDAIHHKMCKPLKENLKSIALRCKNALEPFNCFLHLFWNYKNIVISYKCLSIFQLTWKLTNVLEH